MPSWLATKHNYRAATEDDVKITQTESSPRPVALTASSAEVSVRQPATEAPRPESAVVLVRPHCRQPWPVEH